MLVWKGFFIRRPDSYRQYDLVGGFGLINVRRLITSASVMKHFWTCNSQSQSYSTEMNNFA
jgi:hypothetical protein